MKVARRIFEQWQQRLESDTDMYALRLFAPGGGMVWRNRAACRYYESLGFFAAPVMSWKAVCMYLTADQRAEIEAHYLAAFKSGGVVEFIHSSQAAGHDPQRSVTRFLAVYGTLTHGVLLTHLQPVSASAGFCPAPLAVARAEFS